MVLCTRNNNVTIFLIIRPELIYLDSAATCQKPQELIDALGEYYSLYNSNIARGSYKLADESYKKYHDSKQTIQ